MLNLQACFTKGTIEFRIFQFDEPHDGKQGDIHCGQLKAYIQICLAMNQAEMHVMEEIGEADDDKISKDSFIKGSDRRKIFLIIFSTIFSAVVYRL